MSGMHRWAAFEQRLLSGMQNILEQPWLPIITVAQEDLGSPFQIFISDHRIQCRGQKEAEGKVPVPKGISI